MMNISIILFKKKTLKSRDFPAPSSWFPDFSTCCFCSLFKSQANLVGTSKGQGGKEKGVSVRGKRFKGEKLEGKKKKKKPMEEVSSNFTNC